MALCLSVYGEKDDHFGCFIYINKVHLCKFLFLPMLLRSFLKFDGILCQETLRYVENHLQTVGSNVKQFCTELLQDLLTSSTDSLEDLNSVQIAGVATSEDSNGSVNEDHSQTELINSSSVKSVEDVHLGLPSEQITEDQNSLAHSKGITAPGSLILSQAFKNELKNNDSTADDTSLESMGMYSIHMLYAYIFIFRTMLFVYSYICCPRTRSENGTRSSILR